MTSTDCTPSVIFRSKTQEKLRQESSSQKPRNISTRQQSIGTNFADDQLLPIRIEGWLKVCECAIPQRSHSANSQRQFVAIPWHPGYVVVRRDELSLVCYKNEQAANRCGRHLTRVRLDGGYRAFYRKWGYPCPPPPAAPNAALYHRLLASSTRTTAADALLAESEDLDEEEDNEDATTHEEEENDSNSIDHRRRTENLDDSIIDGEEEDEDEDETISEDRLRRRTTTADEGEGTVENMFKRIGAARVGGGVGGRKGAGQFTDTTSLHENLAGIGVGGGTISRQFMRRGSKPRYIGKSDTSYDLIESSPALESQSLDRRSGAWPLSLHHSNHPQQQQQQSSNSRRGFGIMNQQSSANSPSIGQLQHSYSVNGGGDENSFAMTESPSTSHKLANFLSRPFRSNPLKRTKSVSKLDRKRSALDTATNGGVGVGIGGISGGAGANINGPAWSTPALNNKNIRNSRSHESLLSYSTTTHAIDLASTTTPSKNLQQQQQQGASSSTNNGGGPVVGGCTVTPLHSSVLGTPHCFQIRTDSGATKYYACRTAAERDRWLECLNRTMMPNQDQLRRQENSLQIWILEAKGVPIKRKYYCELCLDHTLYSRTTSKLKTDLCFWGEQFEINHLPKLDTVCINLYREADRKKKKDRNTLVGFVQIPVHTLSARHPVEKWYCVNGAEKVSKGNETPALRVKAKYQSVTILPLRAYEPFIQYLQRDYLQLCLALEPSVSVKAKEDFATSMVRVLHKQRLAKDFLCDLIMSEVRALDNEHLMFRGNSLATKAMEAYMKLVGDQYLHDTLAEFIQAVMESDEDCEVDPQKLSTNLSLLPKNQETLTNKVHLAWGKIVNSFYDFPIELRQVFFELRQRLHRCERSELADYLISSSIFLRFLCPAILSPSLFNLVQEYPSGKTARSLTLIAKTIQTLANFTRFGGKEHYMEFMNKFIEGESDHMRQYLMRISSPLNKDYLSRGMEWEGCIDLGKELSLLHSYLTECWVNIDIKRYREAGLHDLQKTLEQITEAVQNPASPLNSAYPSGSLSPISPISDYENNNQTADDSSPTSETNGGGYSQTIPIGARSYAMYNNNNNNNVSTSKSPLVATSTPAKRLTTNGNGTMDTPKSINNGGNGSINTTPASHLHTDDDYVWYSALDDNLRVRHMGMVVQQSRASKQQSLQKSKTGQLVAGNGTESISYVDEHQSDYFSRGVTEEEDEDEDDQSDEFLIGGDYRHQSSSQKLQQQRRRRTGSHGSLHNSETNGLGNGICAVHHGPNNSNSLLAPTISSSTNGGGNGAVSSGYQSMNYSTSNSSSPVDSSSASSTNGGGGTSTGANSQSSTMANKKSMDNGHHHFHQQQQQPIQSKRVAPLAIANPLYSMQTVPLIQQKAPSYSLPDIHHQAMPQHDGGALNGQYRQQHQHLHDNGYHGSPDSSFEDHHQQQQQQPQQKWSYHPQFNGRPQSQANTPQTRLPLSVLSHSLTPQVLQTLVNHARSDSAGSSTMGTPAHHQSAQLPQSSASSTAADRSPALHHKSPLPRTNPRYGLGTSPLSPRLNGGGIANGHYPLGSTPTVNGGAAPPNNAVVPRTVPPPVRRTRTEGGLGIVVGNIGELENQEDAELSQKFIEELESMKRRLEETQSRIMTEGPSALASMTTSDQDSSVLISTTAPPTLKRRPHQPQQPESPPPNANGATAGSTTPGKWTDQVKPIISRLKVVEHELQEELNSSLKKQQIIEAQQKRIELLVTANERLMATLTQLKDRYTNPEESTVNTATNGDTDSNVVVSSSSPPRGFAMISHSKVSPVLSISSSVSASSSTVSTNDDDHHHQHHSYRPREDTITSESSRVTSELSSVDSYWGHGGGSPAVGSPSMGGVRCQSPQLPPQPSLPAPVLPSQMTNGQRGGAAAVNGSTTSEQFVQLKTTEC